MLAEWRPKKVQENAEREREREREREEKEREKMPPKDWKQYVEEFETDTRYQ